MFSGTNKGGKFPVSESLTHKEIIDAYLHYYRTKKDEYWWAYEKIAVLMESPDGLEFVNELIQACLNDAEIAYVAAGPLEDLIRKHHLAIKDTLIELVRKEAKMRQAIQGVWLAHGSAPRKTLDEILKKYDLKYGGL
jgi:hypothetical protein